MRPFGAVVVVAAGWALQACDVCAGTVTCHTPPVISVGGQFIERKSGVTVGGVVVQFVRQRGVQTERDTITSVTDSHGFFQLRVGAGQDGQAIGDLRVTPPPPFASYVVNDVSLPTSRVGGDGSYLGRLVVDPFLMLVIDVYDKNTGAPVPGATVTFRRVSQGATLEADTMTFVAGSDARFSWNEPKVLQFGVLHAEFELSAPRYPRSFKVRRDIPLSYNDADITVLRLPIGGFGLTYSGRTIRRGTGQPLPGVRVEFRRTSGIQVQPDLFVTTADDNGYFAINPLPLSAGAVTGDLTITPPAPYPIEIIRNLTLASTDDDVVPSLGEFGFGTMEYLSAYYVFRSSGKPVPGGTIAEVKRVGGLPTLADPADMGWRALTPEGRLVYGVATTDTGTTVYDIVLRLPPPFMFDTVKGVSIPSRYSDAPFELGTFRAGPNAASR